jgi:very-short-patch-repair endonuclease
MDPFGDESMSRAAWRLARQQENVIGGDQLREIGFGADAIKHRVARGRLHRLWHDVFAIGRPDVTDRGRWMAAVLACGPGAVLSHRSAGAAWGVCDEDPGRVHVSVPGHRSRHAGIRCHERSPLPPNTQLDGLPVTTPEWTLVDLAAVMHLEGLAKAANEADRLRLIDHDDFAALVESLHRRRGVIKLRLVLGVGRTDSNLERRFVRLIADAGLPAPVTQQHVEGVRVDFYWPELALVVETDGLTYHRTPAQQAVDRKRDQILTRAGITTLRFTNDQVRRESREVAQTLRAVISRLRQQRQKGVFVEDLGPQLLGLREL